MRHFVCIVLSVLLQLSAASLVATSTKYITIENSLVTNVTLHPSLAYVERSFPLSASLLPAGYHTLLLRGLPILLDEASLRVRNSAAPSSPLAALQLLDTSLQYYHHRPASRATSSSSSAPLLQRVQQLEDELAALQDEAIRLQTRSDNAALFVRNILGSTKDANGPGTGAEGEVDSSVRRAQQALDLQDSVLRFTAPALRTVRRQEANVTTLLQDARDKLAEEEARLFDNTVDDAPSFNLVLVTRVFVPEQLSTNALVGNKNRRSSGDSLLVSYQIGRGSGISSAGDFEGADADDGGSVRGAGGGAAMARVLARSGQCRASWVPAYDIRVDSKLTEAAEVAASAGAWGRFELSVDYFASISQSTGEDWTGVGEGTEGVPLTLSTADPAQHISSAPQCPRREVHFSDVYSFLGGISSPRAAGGGRNKAQRMSAKNMAMSRSPEGAMSAPMMASSAGMDMEMEMEDAVMMAPMAATSLLGGSGLDLSQQFRLVHPVSIDSSNGAHCRGASPGGDGGLAQGQNQGHGQGHRPRKVHRHQQQLRESHRIFMHTTSMAASVFSLCSFSADTTAHLQAFVPGYAVQSVNAKAEGSAAAPLLPSAEARVTVDGTLVGSTSVPAVPVGAQWTLPLGPDPHFTVTSTRVLPQSSKTKDAKDAADAGWATVFFTVKNERKKFNVKTEHWLVSARSTHSSTGTEKGEQKMHLLLLTDSLPESADEDIRVELLQPAAAGLITIDSKAASTAEACLRIVLQDAHSPTGGGEGGDVGAEVRTFKCEATKTVYWASWLRTGQAFSTAFEYRVMWPEERAITMTPGL